MQHPGAARCNATETGLLCVGTCILFITLNTLQFVLEHLLLISRILVLVYVQYAYTVHTAHYTRHCSEITKGHLILNIIKYVETNPTDLYQHFGVLKVFLCILLS